ncbi:hypothetical protein J4760_09505 [Salinicoccus sp. ID82-1]|uniref:hypothetical protein n=1 Tax=Salinicoccus sp. ID82-1 TaxID=2820269 RepID=UPI001F44CB5A|nr:hypothetical protein [Salinicoccus sp. ID82-1]
MKNVLLMGVNGRIGQNLYRELKDVYNLFAFSSSNQDDTNLDITFLKKDLFILPEVEKALDGIDIVIFFEDPIMRLNRQTQGRFDDLYVLLADNIARASYANEVEQIIFVGDEVSSDYTAEVLGAYGTEVKVTETPIKRYGKNLSYKASDYNNVRSVQRAPFPEGWHIKDVGRYYFEWLNSILSDMINVEYEGQLIKIHFAKRNHPALVVEYDAESSYDGVEIYRIKGGGLSRKEMNKTPRFEFRELPGCKEFIMALHDFEPKSSWSTYLLTQAPLYALVNRIYQVEMIINSQAPRSNNQSSTD